MTLTSKQEYMKVYNREHYLKNKDNKKEYILKNKDKIKEYGKQWYYKNKDRAKATKLKRTYNLTLDQYNKMLSDQNGCCKICPTELTKPHVDHCHKTDKVRGLLCSNCNTGLGLLKEDTRILNKMIKYIKENKSE